MSDKLVVQESRERARGCGYRRPGLYLESRGDRDGVLPRFVVIQPTSIPLPEDDQPFRGYRYITEELLGRAEEDSPPIGAKFGEFAGRFNAYWTRLAGAVQPGEPAWEAVNWILFRSHEETPKSMILYRLRLIAEAVTAHQGLHTEAKRLISMVE